MKKSLLTIAATLAAVAAFAQGKISFQNDSLHLVYFDPVNHLAADTGGGLTPNGDTASGVTLMADLYMGTSSSSLSLYSSTVMDNTTGNPGQWTAVAVLANSPFVAGGTVVFVETQIRDQTTTAPQTFTGVNPTPSKYYGTSSMFTFTLGTATAYPFMTGSRGNWANGTFSQDSSVYGAGARGAIDISATAVPEPSSFALAGLGAAALLIFRRRK
jgi:hypothetical protein